jgi:Cu/Ag efflux protein CusF
MRSRRFWLILASLLLAVVAALLSYRLLRPSEARVQRHPLTGYVLEVTPEMNRITVRNADMSGTMASMVMDYRVKETSALTGIKPGDTIQATMVSDDSYWLEDITVTGKH